MASRRAELRASGMRRSRRRLLFSLALATMCGTFIAMLVPVMTFALRPRLHGSTCTRRCARAATNTALEPPAWSELEALLPPASQVAPPALTLYRDTNGWCPFCERVWLALREKGIPYDEVLINLYDKPQWYKDMVPTALVPAVKFAGSGEVVWESEAVMRRLDTEFPDTRPLFADPERIATATNLTSRLMNASMGLAYRSGNLTREEFEDKRGKLIGAVDDLEVHLTENGPFLVGGEMSAADCMAIPMLERYGVQLQYFAAALQLRDPARWPAIARWYEVMESKPSYGNRVAGDAYSWTAVAPVLMRIFGGQNGTLSGAAADRAKAADASASSLIEEAEAHAAAGRTVSSEAHRREAVEKLLANHEAVVADAVDIDPKSQKDLRRLAPAKAATVDALLRSVTESLLSGGPAALPVVDGTGSAVDAADVAEGCRYIAARLCAPRDLGAPAALALRAALLGLARRAEAAAVAAA